MLNVNANLFRVAAMCQSSETTRPYLQGVFVEPHRNGATMTATDGRYLVSIYDETGNCAKPVTINLPKHTLAACKSARKKFEPRRLVVSDLGNAFIRYCGKDVGIASETIVDGTFPDWRTVANSAVSTLLGTGKTPMFDQECLRVLCNVARELTDDGDGGFMLEGARAGGAALVRFEGAQHAFGLLMPKITDMKPELPAWYLITEMKNAA